MTISSIHLLVQLHTIYEINLKIQIYVSSPAPYQPKYTRQNKKCSNTLLFCIYYVFAGAKHKNFLAKVHFQTMVEIEVIGRRDHQQGALKEVYDVRLFQIDVKLGEKTVKAIGFVDTQDM